VWQLCDPCPIREDLNLTDPIDLLVLFDSCCDFEIAGLGDLRFHDLDIDMAALPLRTIMLTHVVTHALFYCPLPALLRSVRLTAKTVYASLIKGCPTIGMLRNWRRRARADGGIVEPLVVPDGGLSGYDMEVLELPKWGGHTQPPDATEKRGYLKRRRDSSRPSRHYRSHSSFAILAHSRVPLMPQTTITAMTTMSPLHARRLAILVERLSRKVLKKWMC
jgi:hypothetical protein